MRKVLQGAAALVVVGLLGTTAWAQYSEAPELAAKVAAGELPPVAERLPNNPAVLMPLEENGQYNDIIYVFVPDDSPWNTLQEETERVSNLGYVDRDQVTHPHLAESFDVADDYRSITITTREGAKWSDGDPFDANDILYAMNNWHFDTRVGGGSPFWLSAARRAIKIDDHTVRLESDDPFPQWIFTMGEPAGGDWHAYLPSHYMQQFHIDFNPDADALAEELGFAGWAEAHQSNDWEYQNGFVHLIEDGPVSGPRPVMQPWGLVEVTDSTKVHERNPYFWKVDELGQQLPYIGRIVAGIADPETIKLKIIAGEVDLEWNPQVASVSDYALFKQNEEAGGYTVQEIYQQGRSELSYAVNQTIADPFKRKMFQDVRFRNALSLAIDAEEINQAVFFGLGQPLNFAVLDTTFQMEKWNNNPLDAYDPEQAAARLDAVGLAERNSDGWRLGPDGEPFTLTVEGRLVGEGVPPPESVELLKEYWDEAGISTTINLTEGALWSERRNANLIEVNTLGFGLGSEGRQHGIAREAFAHGSHDMNWATNWGDWLLADIAIKEGRASADDYVDGQLPGEEPPQWAKDLFDWAELRYKSERGSPQYKLVSQQIFDLHYENNLISGVVGQLPALVIAKKNLVNVPTGFFGTAIWFGDLTLEADQLFFRE